MAEARVSTTEGKLHDFNARLAQRKNKLEELHQKLKQRKERLLEREERLRGLKSLSFTRMVPVLKKSCRNCCKSARFV